MNKFYLLVGLCLSAVNVLAQDADVPAESAQATAPSATQTTTTADETKAANNKMVSEGSISLQTTVTGNQEQPRVMYILPWQSPLSPELEMEMLSSQEDAVFGHVERDELQRSLEAAGELDVDDE
ncbi:hypothetical protein [Cellvibrio sp. NN19]|uniref:hypothetical protein n=1 Tax=Cellvibrio chitinivorans TaxID=3102792 RepID=UPI002B41818F|nr:hypothetical protein [Cellvibrio sp. NN19]